MRVRTDKGVGILAHAMSGGTVRGHLAPHVIVPGWPGAVLLFSAPQHQSSAFAISWPPCVEDDQKSLRTSLDGG